MCIRDSLLRGSLPRRALPAGGLIPPGLGGHRTRPFGSQGPAAGTAPPALELTAAVMPHPNGVYLRTARALFDPLVDRGVRVEIQPQDEAGFEATLERGDTDLVLGCWDAEYPDADSLTFGLFDSREGLLRRYHGGPELDRLIHAARTERNAAVRHAHYVRIEESLEREAALLALFHEQTAVFARPEVEGLLIELFHPTVPYEELRVRA